MTTGSRHGDQGRSAAALARTTGLAVVEAVPIEAGLTNRTDRITLADGRVLVVQRMADVALARARTADLTALVPRLRSGGVPVPVLVASDPVASVPFVVTEYVPGARGVTMLADAERGVVLGRRMGGLVRRVAAVPTDGVRLPATWARPRDLALVVGRRLGRVERDVPRDVRDELRALLGMLPEAFAGRPAVLAHGDWAPVNVLVAGDDVVAVVDWEWARLADPLFDVAWWGALVFLFHPAAWASAWPAFLDAAGVELDAMTFRRLRILGPLRVLEVLTSPRVMRDPAARETWAARLIRLLDASEGDRAGFRARPR